MSVEQPITIEEFSDRYRPWARALLGVRWGSTIVVTRGRVCHADLLPGFVAIAGDDPRGLLTYRLTQDECEVITLDSLAERMGIGTSLLNAVRGVADTAGCRRVWLITTNDNTEALRFYQRRGFEIVAVHRGAVAYSRELKPEIPRVGRDGIPIRDEIELELRL